MPLYVVKRKGSPFWYIRGSFHGVRISGASTKTTDRDVAERVKADFETRIIRDGSPQPGKTVTFREATELYLTYRPRTATDRHAAQKLCAIIGDMPLTQIHNHVLVDAANRLMPRAAASTKNRQVMGLASAILHYAAANNICPRIQVMRFKEKTPEPRSITKAQAERLIAAAPENVKAVLIFLFCQGWRISDALRLNWEHIDLSSGTAKYHVRKIDEWRVMPLHARVLTMLGQRTDRSGNIFEWSDKSNFYRDLRPVCKAVGIKFTPHMARHSFATWLVTDGATLIDVMEAGAWRDHKSVLRYAKVNQERVRSVINRIG